MARKLICMMALISLVLLAQAIPGWADTYSLSNLGDSSTYTWTESRSVYPPGSVDGEGNTTSFGAASNTPIQGPDWKIPTLSCDSTLTTYTPIDDYWVTVKITYTTFQPTIPEPDLLPLFAAYNYYDSFGNLITDNPIVSEDAVITTTAIYKGDPATGLPLLENNYIIQDQLIYLEGSGHDADGTFFTFAATLKEETTNHTHSGYFTNFTTAVRHVN